MLKHFWLTHCFMNNLLLLKDFLIMYLFVIHQIKLIIHKTVGCHAERSRSICMGLPISFDDSTSSSQA